MARRGNSDKLNHLNSSERCSQGPVKFTPFILSNLRFRIFLNASVLKLSLSASVKSKAIPSFSSVPCLKGKETKVRQGLLA